MYPWRARAPTSVTSTCTRRSASRMAAVVPVWDRSVSPEHLEPLPPRTPDCPGRRCEGHRTRSAAAPWSAARAILPISWTPTSRMMGGQPVWRGRKRDRHALECELHRAAPRGRVRRPLSPASRGLVAHECILDCPCRSRRPAGDDQMADIAKRLDRLRLPRTDDERSPSPGTLMVEPTESESKEDARSRSATR